MGFQLGHKINLGKKYDSEHRRNISLSLIGKRNLSLIGRPRTEETKLKISKSNKGRVITPEWRENISKSLKGRTLSEEVRKKLIGRTPWNKGLKQAQSFESISGENNKNWKGDKVSYRELHKWVSKKLGKPRKCDFCETEVAKLYDWANISHLYKRDLLDWVRLCRSCHKLYDKDWTE